MYTYYIYTLSQLNVHLTITSQDLLITLYEQEKTL